MLREVILLTEEQATKNRVCDTVISTLMDMPSLRANNGSLKICTNMAFDGIELFRPFNIVLRELRARGVVAIVITLEE